MDRRDAMGLAGAGSYYMQRGIQGSGSGLSPGNHPLSNSNLSFQNNLVGNSIGSSTLPVDPNASLSPHGVIVGAPTPSVPSGERVKRKRGRPRKYGVDGTASLALITPSSSSPVGTMLPTQKRGRGRPPGTGRKQQLASFGEWISGSAGMGFSPHVITIAVGEDITTKIMSFSQQGPRAVCVLSANGAVSTVTLRQPSTSGGTVTYEGRFEILCLSGSFLLADKSGPRGRTGGLSVSLASPDGHVIGGGVGGMLIAASPVQVIVGSFIWGSSKTKKKAGEEGLDGHGADNLVSPTSVVPSNQNLNFTSSLGVWSGSGPVDMQNTHVDIDLMRG